MEISIIVLGFLGLQEILFVIIFGFAIVGIVCTINRIIRKSRENRDKRLKELIEEMKEKDKVV